MDVVEQSSKLPVSNVVALLGAERPADSVSRHGSLLPNSVRALVVGPSGCGKTNAVITLLIMPNGLRFENLYLYATTGDQPMYSFLRKVLENICPFHLFTQQESVIPPAKVQPNSVFVFDDIATEKQDCIMAYFAAGRHKNTDAIYLCQTYTKIPKTLVRDNANFIVVFPQDDRNLEYIYREHVGSDVGSFGDFKTMCARAWNDHPYAFLVIDKSRSIKNGRYRIDFDRFLVPIKEINAPKTQPVSHHASTRDTAEGGAPPPPGEGCDRTRPESRHRRPPHRTPRSRLPILRSRHPPHQTVVARRPGHQSFGSGVQEARYSIPRV